MTQIINVQINTQVKGQNKIENLAIGFNDLRKAMQAASRETEKAKSQLGDFMVKMGPFSATMSTLQSSLEGLSQNYKSFDHSMRAANTMASKSGADFDRLKDSVKDLSREVPVARDALANGLYQTISNGVPEADWMEFLKQSAKSSVGGMADLGQVVGVTSTIIKNYGRSWSDAGEIQDKIQLTAKKGVTSFEQLAAALPRVSGNAATLGVSIDEMLAAFATLTGVSGNTAEVSTQLAAVFSALVKPSSEAGKMAEQCRNHSGADTRTEAQANKTEAAGVLINNLERGRVVCIFALSIILNNIICKISVLEKHILFLVLFLGQMLECFGVGDADLLFSPVANIGGDPDIRSIIQLSDRRMAFATVSGIELYDGAGFTCILDDEATTFPLGGYDGYHHLYLSDMDRYLLVKKHRGVSIVDLDRENYVDSVSQLLAGMGAPAKVDDLFGDSGGRMWFVSSQELFQPETGTRLRLDPGAGTLLDLAAQGDSLLLFYRDGSVQCHLIPSGEKIYSRPGGTTRDNGEQTLTSLLAGGNGGYYQIRNTSHGGSLLFFEPSKRSWQTILESELRMNTLAVAGPTAFVTTNEGLLLVDLAKRSHKHISLLRTRSGSLLASEISTVCRDADGGIWLGMLHRGIFYYHPLSFRHIPLPKSKPGGVLPVPSAIFSEYNDGSVLISDPETPLRLSFGSGAVSLSPDSASVPTMTGEYGSGASFVSTAGAVLFNDAAEYNVFIPVDSVGSPEAVRPIVRSVQVNGTDLMPGEKFDGRVVLTKSAARTGRIVLRHEENFLVFEVALPRFVSAQTEFFYILEGLDRGWNHVAADKTSGRKLRAVYNAVPPGDYRFRVRAGEDAPEAEISVSILPPWWATWWAYMLYLVAGAVAVWTALHVYKVRTRRRIEAEQREKNLLDRIRHLIEEVDRYKTETPEADQGTAKAADDSGDGRTSPESDTRLSESDRAFIAKAVETVERNLNTPGYSVEQLSRDLCIDRTGLYRKLTAMLDRSPSLFIRDIRLLNAARLIKEGKLSITEIAESTGFSSTSYMSKCFQERYGCRPSEYV